MSLLNPTRTELNIDCFRKEFNFIFKNELNKGIEITTDCIYHPCCRNPSNIDIIHKTEIVKIIKDDLVTLNVLDFCIVEFQILRTNTANPKIRGFRNMTEMDLFVKWLLHLWFPNKIT